MSQLRNESLGACCQALGHCVMPKYVVNSSHLGHFRGCRFTAQHIQSDTKTNVCVNVDKLG